MSPLRKEQIAIGQPLPWAVYDHEGQLLLRAGYVVESSRQLEVLAEHGLYRRLGEARLAVVPTQVIEDDPAPSSAPLTRRYQFEELGLVVGSQLQLQRLGFDETRFNTNLYGHIKDVSIMVRMPTQEGRLVLFRDGQAVIVRAFSGTDAFAFNAQVLTVRFAPEPYLHLEYPAYVSGTPVRKQRRVDVRLIATTARLNDDGTTASSPAQLIDLSAAGARLRVGEPLGEVGTRLTAGFRLQTPEGDATLSLEAEIRSTEQDSDGRRWCHGVRFVSLEPMQALALHGYVTRMTAAKDVR